MLFNSKTVIHFLFDFIVCVPVNHAYVFVEASLPHENYALYGIIKGQFMQGHFD